MPWQVAITLTLALAGYPNANPESSGEDSSDTDDDGLNSGAGEAAGDQVCLHCTFNALIEIWAEKFLILVVFVEKNRVLNRSQFTLL